ncbi:hypothetical protein [Bartonella acomydis]|uniref:hypothetical protein n=1 Tax=Bartonella acomydis TaxID=686234 RepID=UPI0031E9936B
MTSSFATYLILSFLSLTIIGFLMAVPVLLLYYMFIKRARLYCKAKGELKSVLQKRDRALMQGGKQEK